MRRGLACVIATLVVVLGQGNIVGASTAYAAKDDVALPTPQWLVYLARDHALSRRGVQTADDALQVRTLLRAAVRLDASRPEPYVWLYELATLRGETQEAAALLGELVRSDPRNEHAFGQWLALGPPDAQTREMRVAWLKQQLETPRPANLQAMVLVQLARDALEQLDLASARAHLERARMLDPANPDVPALLLETLPPDAPAADRLEAMFAVLRSNPVQVELPWQIGALLDELGFAEDASTFYQHALGVHAAADPRGVVPADRLIALSRNALERGQNDEALAYAKQASRVAGVGYGPAIYYHWLLRRTGHVEEATTFRTQLADAFAKIKTPDDVAPILVAEAAWYYCTIDPQPERALMLAQSAAKRAGDDHFVTRVLGYAQSIHGDADAARATLSPIAEEDPDAAAMLAKIALTDGDEAAAQRVVDALKVTPPAGPARDRLNSLHLSTTTSRPAIERYPATARALFAFDRQVLEFHKSPDRFLSATVTLNNLSPRPGEPWWAVLTLTNRADFPITLGPAAMVNPVFLLSFESEGDKQRMFPALLTISVDDARVLRPGQSVRVRRTIDIGPLRKMSRRTPQQVQRVTVRTMLDPVATTMGTWMPSATGWILPPFTFNRVPAQTDAYTWNAGFAALRGDSDAARFAVIEVFGELLGEQQNAALKRLDYTPQPIPATRVRQALLASLAAESWEVRARALDTLQITGLDRQMLDAAESCLSHGHWLVRLMAVRLLGERQGAAFVERASQIANDDADELVRDMARSYIERATSQPAAGDE